MTADESDHNWESPEAFTEFLERLHTDPHLASVRDGFLGSDTGELVGALEDPEIAYRMSLQVEDIRDMPEVSEREQ